MGKIIQVSASRGGLPKRAVFEGYLTADGIEGDAVAHPKIHGGPFQAVLLISNENLEQLKKLGYLLFAGAMGENLTSEGLDLRALRLGDRLQVGEARIELTKVRIPCSALDVYGPSIKQAVYDVQVKAGEPGSPRWSLSGFYAKVLRPGWIRPGDTIHALKSPKDT